MLVLNYVILWQVVEGPGVVHHVFCFASLVRWLVVEGLGGMVHCEFCIVRWKLNVLRLCNWQ